MSKVYPDALRTGSLDKLVPDRGAAVEKIKGELVALGKVEDGPSVKDDDQLLHQLRAPPKLFLCFIHHLTELGWDCDYGSTAPESSSFLRPTLTKNWQALAESPVG